MTITLNGSEELYIDLTIEKLKFDINMSEDDIKHVIFERLESNIKCLASLLNFQSKYP